MSRLCPTVSPDTVQRLCPVSPPIRDTVTDALPVVVCDSDRVRRRGPAMELYAFRHWPSSHELDLAFLPEEKTKQAIGRRAAVLGLDISGATPPSERDGGSPLSVGTSCSTLAAVVFGRWRPVGTMAAVVLFAVADAFQVRAQALDIDVPYQFLVMLPYLMTIVGLVVMTGCAPRAPLSLGVNFVRD